MTQLIIGLGNPEANTRAPGTMSDGCALTSWSGAAGSAATGARIAARVREGTIDGYDVMLAKPQTYMNLSGRAALKLTGKHRVAPRDVIVVHDEADFPLGRVKIKLGGSAAGHRGVQSLIDSWRTDAFPRIRIGIGRSGESNDLIEHVLDPFHPEERAQVEEAVGRAASIAVAIMRDGVEAAMNVWNRAGSD